MKTKGPKKLTIYVINGTGGSGKDTFINYCIEWCQQREYKYVYNISSVDKVKEAAKILGWNGAKSDKDRKFLSDLKMMSIEYNDGPFQYMIDRIEKIKKDYYGTLEMGDDNKLHMVPNSIVVFLHIREPEEIKRVVDHFGAETIIVENSNISNITSNSSDARVRDYEYDIVIDNSGTLDDLKEIAYNFIDEVMRE